MVMFSVACAGIVVFLRVWPWGRLSVLVCWWGYAPAWHVTTAKKKREPASNFACKPVDDGLQ
jgi:hypothetical protein